MVLSLFSRRKGRTVHIPKKYIKKIKKYVDEEDVEWGGYFVFSARGKFVRMIERKGEKTSVNVETENYEVHWHTHPAALISTGTFDQTGPVQPPSIDDIAQSSYKYYSTDFLNGAVLRQVVFTNLAIYIQEPIYDVLDHWFKTKDFDIDTKKTVKIWENKWYKPFRKEAEKYTRKLKTKGLDLGGFINDDTGQFEYLPKKERDKLLYESYDIEQEYFDLCAKYGIRVTKTYQWKKELKNGLSIKLF